jgi:signal transduction histidine kinase
MPQSASQSTTNVAEPSGLSDEIRDGLLQDLVAVGLILRHLEQTSESETVRRLTPAATVIDADIRVVRGLIDRLRINA